MGAGDREKGGRCACLVRCIFLFRQTGRIWLWIHQRGPTRQGGSRLPGSPFEGGGWHAGSPLEGEDGGSTVDTRQNLINVSNKKAPLYSAQEKCTMQVHCTRAEKPV